MKCVVTGGAGFIGSHIVDLLVEQGMDVVVFDDLSTGAERNLNRRAKFVHGDIRDVALLAQHCRDVELFFHAAARPRIQPSFDEPIEHEEVNVIGTIRCLQAVGGVRVRKFVFSSSSAIYGNTSRLPTPEDTPPDLLNPYALQKYTAERYCLILARHLDVPVVALRYFNVYGPRSFNEDNPYNAYSNVIGIFNEQRKRGIPLTITGDGEQRRDFVHVYDVARANLEAALSDKVFEVYNVGCGRDYSVYQIAAMFCSNVSFIPERKGEARVSLADISKIKRDLDWTPHFSVEEGIRLLKDVG